MLSHRIAEVQCHCSTAGEDAQTIFLEIAMLRFSTNFSLEHKQKFSPIGENRIFIRKYRNETGFKWTLSSIFLRRYLRNKPDRCLKKKGEGDL